MKFTKVFFVLLTLISIATWIFRWDVKENPQSNLTEYHYDKFSNQSWTVTTGPQGRLEIPSFSDEQKKLYADANKLANFNDQAYIELEEKISSLEKKVATNKAIIKEKQGLIDTITKNIDSSGDYFILKSGMLAKKDVHGICRYIDEVNAKDGSTEIWCKAGKQAENEGNELEKLKKEQNEKKDAIVQAAMKIANDELAAKAWDGRKLITTIMIVITSVSLLLTVIVFLIKRPRMSSQSLNQSRS
ncbi:hypothetical protein J2T17_004440 [Paenibacillus mucilaginosus]|uniref:hypothetical protein n=1 Tax=Paenibacillus mucilaginosus TaxID=61624 RepID=UPI003D23E1A5